MKEDMDKSCIRQLKKWVDGVSEHNKERDECCPDFSCCTPETLAPKDERERFVLAVYEDDSNTMYEMLGIFLGRSIENYGKKKVYISTGNPGGTA